MSRFRKEDEGWKANRIARGQPRIGAKNLPDRDSWFLEHPSRQISGMGPTESLRLRHQPFAIGQAERDAWLGHMTAAVDSLDLAPGVRKALLDYFETASAAMINVPSR